MSTHTAGLDIAGAFDSADHVKIPPTLLRLGVSELLVRFIGAWLFYRVFRVRLCTATGAVLSDSRCPTKGVPQGGVPPPHLM